MSSRTRSRSRNRRRPAPGDAAAGPPAAATATRLAPRAVRPLLAVVSGACIFLATATFDLWPLAWIALVPLLLAIRGTSPRRAFGLGTLAGVVTNTGGF